MSDSNLTIQRQILDLQDGHEVLRKADVPALYLPWTQRTLNPFPLASSGGAWGDSSLPWATYMLALYVSVFVNGTNNGTNFWTIALVSSPSSTTLASVTTSAISGSTFTRLSDVTITQPSSTDNWLQLVLTATLSPAAIFVTPAVALLRTGN